jgi:hypothetical protein
MAWDLAVSAVAAAILAAITVLCAVGLACSLITDWRRGRERFRP